MNNLGYLSLEKNDDSKVRTFEKVGTGEIQTEKSYSKVGLRHFNQSMVIACIAMAFLVVTACNTNSSSTTPSEVQVDFVLNGSTLTPIAVGNPSNIVPSDLTDNILYWEFKTSNDVVLDSGKLNDPRQFRAEFDKNGIADAINVASEVGVFSLVVPNQQGTLHIWNDSQEIAQASLNFSGENVGQHESALVNLSTDLIGAPQLVAGNGAAENVSLLFVPDGFTESEMESFHDTVDILVNGLKNTSGYTEHWDRFNLWRQDIRSPQSGIADPKLGTNPTTAFEGTFGTDQGSNPRRCIFYDKNVGTDVLAATNTIKSSTGSKVVIVVANTEEYGGCAAASQGIMFVTRNSLNYQTVSHELGHALFNLADEYGGNSGVDCNQFNGINVSYDLAHLPWKDLINTSTIPTPVGAPSTTVGAFEGGGYCDTGMYRPQEYCKMRSSGNEFCAVCRHRLEEYFDALPPVSNGTTTSSNSTSNDTGSQTSSCSHSECTNGSKLVDGCSSCATTVCKTDSYCCNTAWDDTCVGEAKTLCDGTCGGSSSTGSTSTSSTSTTTTTACVHSECSTGSALSKSCSTCAAAVCNADAYCCTTAWDDQCVKEVADFCNNQCN